MQEKFTFFYKKKIMNTLSFYESLNIPSPNLTQLSLTQRKVCNYMHSSCSCFLISFLTLKMEKYFAISLVSKIIKLVLLLPLLITPFYIQGTIRSSLRMYNYLMHKKSKLIQTYL